MVDYVLHYVMTTGRAQREVLTAAQALVDYRGLQSAGASSISVVDPSGARVTLPELLARATEPVSVSTERPQRQRQKRSS